MKIDNLASKFLERIAIALENIAPKNELKNELHLADGYVWQADRRWLEPVDQINRVDIALLQGIDRQIALFLAIWRVNLAVWGYLLGVSRLAQFEMTDPLYCG